MKDRLIELIKQKSCVYVPCDNECGGCHNTEMYDDEIESLADHLLAEGVIVPPCKVGDIVYSYTHSWRKEDGISPYQITNITITQNKKGEWTKKYRAMEVKNGKTIDNQLNFAFDEIGKTVFLTREEAEQALKGEDTDDARG